MDSTPPSHQSSPNLRPKSASRLARIRDLIYEKSQESPQLSLDIVPSSPSILSPKPPSSLPLQELSPSPLRRSKNRVVERFEMAEEPIIEPAGARRRCKSRGAQMGLLGCASPRNSRRSRRRVEQEIREEKDLVVVVEEIGKARKRRHSGRSKKERLSLVSSYPSSSLSPKINNDDRGNLDRMGQLITDLIMWQDVTKSSFWFGFGSLCFLSSCFATGISFSIFSVISQLGLLFLGVSFFSNSFCQRDNLEKARERKLKEEDILRVARVILPAANFAISKTRELFSGEPHMTLKVVPFLLVGAEYGHLLTLRRLCAMGFFISFTVPKLYSYHADQINKQVEYLKWWVLEVWGACSHKKIVAASAATAFWNLSSAKTRIFAAFISLVIVRYYRQRLLEEEREAEEGEQGQQQQALILVEGGSKKQ